MANMRDQSPDHVQIWFPLERDHLGYPATTEEALWAVRAGDGYELHSVPFYVRVATAGDIVSAVERGDKLWYVATLRYSGNSLIRVSVENVVESGPISDKLREMGCLVRVSHSRHLLAVSIPPGGALPRVQAYLAELKEREVADYEEPMLWD